LLLLIIYGVSLAVAPIKRCGYPCGTHSSNSFPSRPFRLPGGPRFETKHAMGSVWPRLVLLPWKPQRKESGFFLESPELTLERDSSRVPTGRQGARYKRSPSFVRSTSEGLPPLFGIDRKPCQTNICQYPGAVEGSIVITKGLKTENEAPSVCRRESG
jgi:hypothetical protein